MVGKSARDWLILADDLTGAADSAAPFASRGRTTVVGWSERCQCAVEAQVLAYDAATRDLPAEAAARVQSEILQAALRDRAFFKKIDSTLRGQPASEIAALAPALRGRRSGSFGVFAPAFPAMGRTTVGGRVRLRGALLEESEVWGRDHSYPTADLLQMLARVGVPARLASLDVVRDARALSGLLEAASQTGEVLVCDAQTDADLLAIARAGETASAYPFFIGSGGLAHALAALSPASGGGSLARQDPHRGTLLVVGSLAAASRLSARRLAWDRHVTRLAISPESLLSANEEAAQLADTAGGLLTSGRDVLIELEAPEPIQTALSSRLAAALADSLASIGPQIGALAATGGETAAALLRRFGVDGVRLMGEIEPGVPFGETFGALTIPLVTKAGAFGDQGCLGRIAAALRPQRNQDTPT